MKKKVVKKKTANPSPKKKYSFRIKGSSVGNVSFKIDPKASRKPQETFSTDELRNLRISFGKRERQRIQIYKDEIKSLKHSLSRKAQQWLNSESKYQKLLASIKKLIDAG